jgi:hypothetical protein
MDPAIQIHSTGIVSLFHDSGSQPIRTFQGIAASDASIPITLFFCAQLFHREALAVGELHVAFREAAGTATETPA